MRVWDEFVGESDRAIYDGAGFGGPVGQGVRPAVVVIDVTYSFCGPDGSAGSSSMVGESHRTGIDPWDAVDATRSLLDAARSAGAPIFYTAGIDYRADGRDAGRWRDKSPRLVADSVRRTESGDFSGNRVVSAIAPVEGDFLLRKAKPSAFFGTPLDAYLNDLGVDTLLVTGVTTSGCVRATVIDAFSRNYRVNVVEDCTFDRSRIVHAMSLFDMNCKYADVVSLGTATEYLGSVASAGGAGDTA